jgi:2-dehydro-3-deoxyphosphogluconate aldolase/(4S)-4-hydroxy-2-oxoglutarate aldolase
MSDLLTQMIPKIGTLQRIVEKGIVAVVRAETSEQAEKIARACIAGGVDTIEITFTVPGAHKVIEGLRDALSKEELLIGAGTVLDAETARTAILAGSQYIVGPGFDLPTAKLCNRYQVPYMAGCMTPTEIVTALEAGVDVIKVFPGSAFGPSIIKAFRGPLPQAPMMPTGGVSLDNVAQWIKNGCIAVGVGGQLTAGAKTGEYEKITEAGKEFIKRIQEARGH